MYDKRAYYTEHFCILQGLKKCLSGKRFPETVLTATRKSQQLAAELFKSHFCFWKEGFLTVSCFFFTATSEAAFFSFRLMVSLH